MSRRGRLVSVSLVLIAALGAPLPATANDDAPVADAAAAGDVATVRTLLRGGGDVNAAQGDGMTALHWAAMNGDADLVTTLLYAGANPRATTRIGGYTPLLVAGRYGQGATVAALLKGGADPTQRSAAGATPLMLASASGNLMAVESLIEGGADVDAADGARGQTALMFAASNNMVGVIDLLVAAGADVHTRSAVADSAALYTEMIQGYRNRGRIRAAIAAIENPPPPEPEENEDATAEDAADDAAGEEEIKDPAAELKGDDGADKSDGEPDASDRGEALPEGIPPDPSAELKGDDGKDKANGETEAETDDAEEEGEGDEILRLPPPPRLSYGDLVGAYGGMTPLLHAVRQGHVESVQALLELGADINQVSADNSNPLLVATINGHFDLALSLIEQGADPTFISDAGATPLYAALNVQWAPKTLRPQPRAHLQQQHTHIDVMRAALEAGADPNVRLKKKIWYSGYNFDLSGVNEIGGTPFWRAAYGSDIPAMRLLVEYGADTTTPTTKPPGRPRTGDSQRDVDDVSGLPPVEVGGPAVPPLHAAAGVGYGEGFAANSHRNAPGAWMAAVQYLTEELGADVNAVDHEGNTALHHAAARGDNEMIRYLVAQGADVTRFNREGNSTADMANGPVQRIQPFPETVELLVSLGAVNNDKCVSC
jgi:ankyrin repeat protein